MDKQPSNDVRDQQGDSQNNLMIPLEKSFASLMSDDFDEFQTQTSDNNKTGGLTNNEAIQLLKERTKQFGKLFEHQHMSHTDAGSCCWVLSSIYDNLAIEAFVRGDTKAIILSTVVHRLSSENPPCSSRDCSHQQSGRSYSLMTRMMKHNALLTAKSRRSVVGHARVYREGDGRFVLVSSVSISILLSKWKLFQILHDFTMKAILIKRDFEDALRGAAKDKQGFSR